ncbi:MAG: QueT transporter family protein [Clostridia bacterium]|nr:QueT transporter family protein [Clostridia bacterium]
MNKFNTKRLALSGVIAGLYVALTYAVFPLASGAIQFRLSEGLTLLPLIFPEAIVGVFVGCLISNIITGCAIWDVVFGSLITLIAGILTFIIGKVIKKMPLKIFVGGLFPVLLNAFFLPVIWYFCYGELEFLYYIQVAFLLLGQSVSVYLIGTVLVIETDKRIIKNYKKEETEKESAESEKETETETENK